jgi:ribonuclease P protein subunit RPR2
MARTDGKQKKKRRGEDELQQLLALAATKTPSNLVLARNAVKDAFRLSQTMRVRIPREQKRQLCKHCYTFLKPGVTSSTRVHNGRIIITCTNCKHVKRLQYK